MRATTHTEVYRRFEGELRAHPMRPLVLALSAMRQGFKRKLPALLLFIPVGITTIVNCFRVYFGYVMAAREAASDDPRGTISAAAIQQVLGDTVHNVLEFLMASSFFGLLVMAWYGAGLIAEDRRMGANLLYFSRPLTRSGYVTGKLLAAFGFGYLATVVPCLVICSVAAFSSPQWSFLREEWDAILASVAFAALWTTTVSLLVLAVSSVVQRKTHALVGIVGIVVLSGLVSEAFSHLAREVRLELFGLFSNFERLGNWMLKGEVDPALGIQPTLLVLAALWIGCLLVISSRVRRMEVVG